MPVVVYFLHIHVVFPEAKVQLTRPPYANIIRGWYEKGQQRSTLDALKSKS